MNMFVENSITSKLSDNFQKTIKGQNVQFYESI